MFHLTFSHALMLLSDILALYIGMVVFVAFIAVIQFITGKIMGYMLLVFRLPFISFVYENGRITTKISSKNICPYCAMTKIDSTKTEDLIYGFLPTVIYVVTSVTLFFLLINKVPRFIQIMLIFGIIYAAVASALTLYVVYINFFSRSEKAKIQQDIIKQRKLIQAGVRPGEMTFFTHDPEIRKYNSLDFPIYVTAANIRYNYFLDRGEYDKLAPYAQIFAMNLPVSNTLIHGYISIIYELIFFYSYIQPDPVSARKLFDRCKEQLENDMDINGRRVLAYYFFGTERSLMGAEQAAREGLACAHLYPHRGIAKLEEELLHRLLAQIENIRQNEANRPTVSP